MSLAVSQRCQRVKPSPTMAVTAKAAELRAQGRDVIDLGAGEPDFDTPTHIKAAGIAAINAGQTKYTAVEGTAALKKAIIDKYKRDNHLEYGMDQILVSCGAKQTCYNVCSAILNAGDEAIVPAPYWVSYPDMIKLADAEPVIVAAMIDDGFKITPRLLEAAITPRTRLVFLNSPSNPTGAAYTRAELQALGEVLEKHPGIVIAADDMYEHIYWADEPFVSFAEACPGLYDRTVTINGVSKAYAMTGWRIGYAGGPKSIIAAMKKIQSQSTSNPSSISQAASVAALNGDQSCVREMTKAFRQRHDYVVEALNGIPGFHCLPSAGTFYAFPNVSDVLQKKGLKDDLALAELLLNEGNVAVVPGSAFGAPGYLRLSFACSLDSLKEAIKRMTAVTR
ncbi:MAG: pyridoxal phosphate-dependent aminotransferase [Gammaproteobacteria bacterium PRO9]|nr:pyridoxal phosphate-dependent aminotransferase [Gammaproteobacteria bacterium PRO9]